MNTSEKHSSSAAISNEVEPALQAAEGRILAAIAYQLTGEKKWISEPYNLLPPVGGVKKKDRRNKQKGIVDKVSAVLILQSYLENQK